MNQQNQNMNQQNLKPVRAWALNARTASPIMIFNDTSHEESTSLHEEENENSIQLDAEIIQKEKENIENVFEPSSFTSEDVHGGKEATGDIENSPNAKEDGKENKNDIINNIIPLLQTGNEDNNENENENEENKINEKENDEYKENEDNNENENEENKINEKENDEDNNKNDINGEDWGIKNSRQAFSLDNRYTINRLKAVFAAVIGKVAEDLSYEITEGDDEWDMNALLMRRYSGRSIFSCRQSRKKERVVIALDTSGSCMKQADFFANIAEIALQLGDVELYDAPNGETFSYNNGQGWQSFFDHQSRIIPWHMLRGRHIIFFGDFDAAVFVVDASMKNKVYWFSCETRYETSSEYGWFLGSGQGKFKGKYFRCVDEEDFIKLSKKIK